ncbi:MAG: sigma-54 dependent transcriptional regulator [bacterium]|nr:sigma-54 dependent transcriptional regulator [bacterium]MDT8395789.1 sigma-54 dependent transcriptional regulator [bacterium]
MDKDAAGDKRSSELVLIVDDERRVRESVRSILQDEGYSVIEAAGGQEGLGKAAADKPDCVLLDIWMPGMDGIEVLTSLKQVDPDLPVIIMSGHGNIETAVKASKLGAYDFLEKPLSIDKLILVLRNALSQRSLVEENRALREGQVTGSEFIGHSPTVASILEQVRIVAPTQASVLITGENGTGKELLARSIHSGSRRSSTAFVAVNCAAIPDNLIESELFGHERGAFTGAVSRKVGKFDLAHQGTLFLDEIGDMSLATQAKILRVLEERVFQRVGGNRDIAVDVRVVAATNKDLSEEIASGAFREDLFFRLNVFPFHLPPLRERREDILLLLDRFLGEYGRLYGKPDLTFSPEAEASLVGYQWPGNVRELRNVVERLAIIAPDKIIDRELIPPSVRERQEDGPAGHGDDPAASEADYRLARERFERSFFSRRLEENDWNISRTAETVGLERSNLHRKMKQLGIKKLS